MTGLLRRIFEVFQKAGQIHLPTILLGIVSILFLFYSRGSQLGSFYAGPDRITAITAKIFVRIARDRIHAGNTKSLSEQFFRSQPFFQHFPDIFSHPRQLYSLRIPVRFRCCGDFERW
jgi:hypothetical protein